MSTDLLSILLFVAFMVFYSAFVIIENKRRSDSLRALIKELNNVDPIWESTVTTTVAPVKLTRQMFHDIVSQRSSKLPDSQEGDRWAWVVQSQAGGPYRLDIDVDGLTDAIWEMIQNEFEDGSTRARQASPSDTADDTGSRDDSQSAM